MQWFKRFVFGFPFHLDRWFRWYDFRTNRIDPGGIRKWLKLATGYSGLPVWLPIPLLAFLAYGPLVFDRWRGGWLAVGLAVAIVVHLLVCRMIHGRALAQAQWLVLAGTALILLWRAGDTARQTDPRLYSHMLLLFVPIVLTLGVPAGRLWADLLFRSKRQDYRASFAGNLGRIQLFVKPVAPPPEWARVVRAYFLVPLLSPAMLFFFPAIVVLIADRRFVLPWFIGMLVATWVVLAAVHYNERLTALQDLLGQAFFRGGPRVLSVVLILLAVARLAGISYVTTMLDAASRWTLAALLASLYVTLWLYDYWTQRALAEVLLGLLDPRENHPYKVTYEYEKGTSLQRGAIQIHGGGRFLAVDPFDPPARPDKFQAYLPLALFQEIRDQLIGRARAARTKDAWKIADAADERLETLEQRVALYHAVPAALIAVLLVLNVSHVFQMTQQPGLVVGAEPASDSPQVVDLRGEIETRAGTEPVFAVAASGGGTRAALYTYSVLREIHRRGLLDRLVLLSGVSGGSAGIAYFAAHHAELSFGDEAWPQYRCAVTEPYIRDVLAGVGETRFLEGARIGQLLTEAFERRILAGSFTECGGLLGSKIGAGQATLGYVAETAGLGLIFNTSVVGSFEGQDQGHKACLADGRTMRECANVATAGSRLALTNVAAMTEKNLSSDVDGWPLDMSYSIHHDPSIPLATAASLSANFPPVFSNAAVAFQRDGVLSRYWVTDGGAVENRALISLLLALRAAFQAEEPPDETLPPIKVLVAEASAFSVGYREDRGVGAAAGAKGQIAAKLIGELARDVDALYRVRSAGRSGVEIVYLPMPGVLRVNSAFGTHWMMPDEVEVRDPDTWYLPVRRWYRRSGAPVLGLDRGQLLEAADLLFATDTERDARAENEAMRKLFVWFGEEDPRKVLDRALPSVR